MPIPLLFMAAAAGSALFGVGKGVKAGVDQKDANDTNRMANLKVEEAKKKVNTSRKNCGYALDNLGKRKVAVLDGSIKTFINEFEKLNHVELTESTGLNELQKLVLDKKSFTELKSLQGMASSLVGGLASGTMAGALTAFGAYGAASALATASTGTAIASLSGAAVSIFWWRFISYWWLRYGWRDGSSWWPCCWAGIGSIRSGCWSKSIKKS